jgi:hypothetical protein
MTSIQHQDNNKKVAGQQPNQLGYFNNGIKGFLNSREMPLKRVSTGLNSCNILPKIINKRGIPIHQFTHKTWGIKFIRGFCGPVIPMINKPPTMLKKHNWIGSNK